MDDRSPAERSRTMAAVRSKDTTPERRLRSALHAAGVRFRLGQVVAIDGLKLRPDIAFRGARVAVFVDGCFWHGCPDHCRMPGSNTDYWAPKIERNRRRDVRTDEALLGEGWVIVRVWEHEDAVVAAERVAAALDQHRKSQPVRSRELNGLGAREGSGPPETFAAQGVLDPGL